MRAFDDYDPMTQRAQSSTGGAIGAWQTGFQPTAPKFPDVASARAAAEQAKDKNQQGSNYGYSPTDTLGKYQTPGTTASISFPTPPPPVVAPAFPGNAAGPIPPVVPMPVAPSAHDQWMGNMRQSLGQIGAALNTPPVYQTPQYTPPAYSYTPAQPKPGISPLSSFVSESSSNLYKPYQSNPDAYTSNPDAYKSAGTPVPKHEFSSHHNEIQDRRMIQDVTGRRPTKREWNA